MKYSELVREHFINPVNNGVPEKYNAYAKGYNPDDGDRVEVFINIVDKKIENIGYLIKGCPRAIAAASYTSELVKGITVDEVLKIPEEDVGKALQLTDPKFQCVPLTLKTIKNALRDRRNREV